MKKASFFGISVPHQTASDVLAELRNAVANTSLFRIYTPNPEILLKARADAEYADVLRSAECLLPDGAGMLFFSSLKQRITGVDMCDAVVKTSVDDANIRIFLLGAGEGVAQAAAVEWQERYPGARIVGSFADCSPSQSDSDAILSRIVDSGASVVMVAFGAPAQEKWIHNYSHLCPNVSVWLGIGGTFDFVAGVYKRAPRFFQLLRLEWLYRLMQQPSRIGRIWNAVVVFSFYMLLEKCGLTKKPTR